MPPKNESLRRPQDGHWVQLTAHPLRLDQVEGVKGVATRHTYTLFKAPEAVKSALRDQSRAVIREGFRIVSRLGRFKDVPPEQWLDTRKAPPRKPAKRAPLPAPLEARVAQLERTPGVVVKVKRGKPATAKAIAAAERELGRPLPPSLRAFLGRHDGLTIEWTHDEYGWGVAFEVWPLRAMLKERAFRGEMIAGKGGLVLPIAPTFGRPVLGALLRDRGEASIFEWSDPPDGKVYRLAPDFATYVDRAVKTYFVVSGRHDVSEKWLPAIRKVVGR